ncbi:MAG: MBL fold metallo-hydrolase [Candidatus Cohnella colombiensis]|uniref:MBL fold metallo-hydrolase n=1 Tax=Candidatus Cohnella colombiensis TaxID=3121368 RepID=A0AA95F002_9BACL|nr:MAG: MBL fold metallo-hydrolase [Cohnella sp.]
MNRNYRQGLWLFVLIVCLIVLQACSKVKEETVATLADAIQTSPQSGASDSTSEESSEASPEDTGPKIDTETLKNTTGKTMIKSVTAKFGNHMSFAIVSKEGTVIVADPNHISTENGLLQADIITSSFINHSHQDAAFNSYNPNARISEMKAETFTVKDITVTGVAASQSTDPIVPEAPTNVIYVYEVDGLRIAYIGGLGQDELTEDQLKELGKLDIVLDYFNYAPSYNIKKDTTIKVMQQLNPRIIIPTEYKAKVVEEIVEALKIKDQREMDYLAVDKADIEAIKEPAYIFLK